MDVFQLVKVTPSQAVKHIRECTWPCMRDTLNDFRIRNTSNLRNVSFHLIFTNVVLVSQFKLVPRKVLKEKYQGEPEPDEMFEDETEGE